MPQTATTGGGLMGYPTTVDTGQVQPLTIFEPEVAGSYVVTNTLVANVVYLYGFDLNANITASGMNIRTGATAAGNVDVGIYSFAGTLLGHSGATGMSANANQVISFTANIMLSPGQYFLALCASSSSDNIGTTNNVASRGPLSRTRQATNTGTAGVLPNTTGGYSNQPNQQPAMELVIVGGLV